jgi:hypothetical protein
MHAVAARERRPEEHYLSRWRRGSSPDVDGDGFADIVTNGEGYTISYCPAATATARFASQCRS